jgi:hypothetical protein
MDYFRRMKLLRMHRILNDIRTMDCEETIMERVEINN